MRPIKWLLYIIVGVCLVSYPAFGLVMRENGPEPIIVQINESLRLSDDLDNRLSQLATAQTQNGLSVRRWYAGNKLLVMLSFPANFTEQRALAFIAALRELPAVEKVVPASAFNLEFTPADIAREYTSSQAMPEASKRGLDRDEVSRLPMTQSQINEAAQMPHVPNQLIVRWKSKYAWRATAAGFLRNIANFHASIGTHVLQEMKPSPTDLIQVIEFEEVGASLAARLRQYLDCPWVDYAQPNYVYSANVVTPNDQFYTNPGQPTLPKIKAPEAWNITTGNHDVVVAVADSGVNISHPDFVNRLSPGWHNFVAGSTDVNDDFLPVYHGSNVAGIVGAQGNNGPDPGSNGGYMAGVAWDVRLLIIKVLDQNGGGNSVRFAQGIDYAYTSDQGHPPAIAINCSWGLTPASTIDSTLAGAIDRARAHNMVVVTAAGNSNLNCELPGNLISPASCPRDNIIAVGATRVRPDDPIRDDTKTDFSNFGKYRVELGAPGGEDPPNGTLFGVLGLSQLLLENGVPAYTKISGTSMAAPHVTGALALVKSQYPWEDYVGIRDRVIMGTDDLAALNPDGHYSFSDGWAFGSRKGSAKANVDP